MPPVTRSRGPRLPRLAAGVSVAAPPPPPPPPDWEPEPNPASRFRFLALFAVEPAGVNASDESDRVNESDKVTMPHPLPPSLEPSTYREPSCACSAPPWSSSKTCFRPSYPASPCPSSSSSCRWSLRACPSRHRCAFAMLVGLHRPQTHLRHRHFRSPAQRDRARDCDCDCGWERACRANDSRHPLPPHILKPTSVPSVLSGSSANRRPVDCRRRRGGTSGRTNS